MGVGNLAHFFDGGAHVVLAEQGRAGDKRVGASAGAFGAGLEIDAAIHLDAIRGVSARAATPRPQVALILRSAQVGAAYLGQSVSFLFGSVIPPPSTDENGLRLSPGANTSYWFGRPYTTNNFTNAPYYWSPNAQAVSPPSPASSTLPGKR